jgi:hypothetical protein
MLLTRDTLADALARLRFSGLRAHGSGGGGLIATWSLSEIPLAVRDEMFPAFSDLFDHHLITWQPVFEGIDNSSWFARFMTYRPNIPWKTDQFEISTYLMS